MFFFTLISQYDVKRNWRFTCWSCLQ